MKTLAVSLLAALSVLATALSAEQGPSYKGSKEFEKIKSLAGTWKGTMKAREGDMEITVEYRVVADGSAVEERDFAGTPKEMITMYTEANGKLRLTHYCMLHNQPAMKLKTSNDTSLSFDFDPSCRVDASKETHMHSLVLTFVDADTIQHNWTLWDDGKPAGSHPITLKRVKKKKK